MRRFYEGFSEIEISGELEDRAANKTVSRPRIKLNLFMESDLKPPFEKQEFVKLADASLSIKEIERKAGSRLLRHNARRLPRGTGPSNALRRPSPTGTYQRGRLPPTSPSMGLQDTMDADNETARSLRG